jgi:hypothetical protein
MPTQPEPRTLKPETLPGLNTEHRTLNTLLPWLAGLAILGLFLAFRVRGIGHLLIWDEAMDLCSVRAFVTSSHDAFSNAFWAHPPLFPLLMAGLDPLRAGFAERCQALSIGVQALNLGLLFLLNRRLFGTPTALLSCAVLACLPGAVFFDVWIKRDHLVVFFSLLTLLALSHARVLSAGVLLGAALLAKESALFTVAALLVLAPRLFPGREGRRNLAGLVLVAAAASVWWYALFGIMTRTYLRFALGRETVLTGWNRPWTYYVERAWLDLGPAAVAVLAAGGVAAMIVLMCRKVHPSMAVSPQPQVGRVPPAPPIQERRGEDAVALPSLPPTTYHSPPPASPFRFWPLAMLVPAYVYLGLARGKAPWLTMVLYPAWATAIGYSAGALYTVIAGSPPALARQGRRLAAGLAVAAILAALVFTAWRRDYDVEQERLGFGQRWGSTASRQAAATLNDLVSPGQRVLITPFWYWGDDPIPTPCPIFSYYLKDMPVLLKSFHMTPDEFVDTVRSNRIHWALLSPPPVTGEAGLLNPLIHTHGLQPRVLSGCVVFRTDGLWETASATP